MRDHFGYGNGAVGISVKLRNPPSKYQGRKQLCSLVLPGAARPDATCSMAYNSKDAIDLGLYSSDAGSLRSYARLNFLWVCRPQHLDRNPSGDLKGICVLDFDGIAIGSSPRGDLHSRRRHACE